MKHSVMKSKDKAARRDLQTFIGDLPMQVGAGAGAGKTTATSNAVIEALQKNIAPEQICLVTFTNKAAQEMVEKGISVIEEKIGSATTEAEKEQYRELQTKLQQVPVSTIHSFAFELLRRYPQESTIGYAYKKEDPAETEAYQAKFIRKYLQDDLLKRCREMGLGFGPADQNGLIKRFGHMIEHQDAITMNEDTTSATYRDSKAFLEKEAETLRNAALSCIEPDDLIHVAPALRNILMKKQNIQDEAKLFRFIDTLTRYYSDVMCWARNKNRSDLWDELTNRFCAGYSRDQVVEWQKTIQKDTANWYKKQSTLPPDPESYEWTQGAIKMIKDGACTCTEKPFLRILQGLTAMLSAVNKVPTVPDTTGIEMGMTYLQTYLGYFTDCIVTEELAAVRAKFLDTRKTEQRISDNECLLLAEEMLRDHPSIRKELHDQYRLIFVDEYQDTDPIQVKLLISIIAEDYDTTDWRKSKLGTTNQIVCIGDPKQSIYRFRNADITLWNETNTLLTASGGKDIQFLCNYRSTQSLCNYYNAVFGEDGSLAMDGKDGQVEYEEMVSDSKTPESPRGPVHLHSLNTKKEDELAELAARAVIKEIQEIRKFDPDARPIDFLLLSRNKHKTKTYMDAFKKAGIPLQFNGKQNYTEYKGVKTLINRTGAVTRPQDNLLLMSILLNDFGISLKSYADFMNALQTATRPDGTKYPHTLSALIAIATETSDLDTVATTPEQEYIVSTLKLLRRDQVQAKKLSPVAFLSWMIDAPDGIFRFQLDPLEMQEAYAVAHDVLDMIRTANPAGIMDMYSMLEGLDGHEMDSMPNIRSDDSFVRMMNLHKAKGLEGKYVFLLPDTKKKAHAATTHVERNGSETRIWYRFIHSNALYTSQVWEDVDADNKEALLEKQEEIRLLYVAATRAKRELHIFTPAEAQDKSVWKGLEGGTEKREIEVDGKMIEFKPLTANPYPPVEDAEIYPNASPTTNTPPDIRDNLQKINSSKTVRVTPSKAKATEAMQDITRFETIVPASDHAERTDQPGGTIWGTMVHRTAELLVNSGRFTTEALHNAARQSVFESLSETLEDPDKRQQLLLDDSPILEDDRAKLIDKLDEALAFMVNPTSPLRALMEGHEVYPEVPFTLSQTRDGIQEEIYGIMDLLIKTPEGWILVDYKTDRPLEKETPAEHANRLLTHYSPQIQIYANSLEGITGQTVIQKYLCSIPSSGALIQL